MAGLSVLHPLVPAGSGRFRPAAPATAGARSRCQPVLPRARQRYAELHLADPHRQRQIGRRWDRSAVERALSELGSRLRLQPEVDQGPFKVSHTLMEPEQGIIRQVHQTLRQRWRLRRQGPAQRAGSALSAAAKC